MKNPRARTIGRGTGTLPSLIAFGNIVLIVASLYWAQAILIPVALAILLTFLLSPVAGALERIVFGRLPSVILIVALTFSLHPGSRGGLLLPRRTHDYELPTYRK